MTISKLSLGTIVYVPYADGTVKRSFVDKVTEDGHQVFNRGDLDKYSPVFLEAVEISTDILIERKKALQTEIAKIDQMLHDNGSLSHQDEVDAAKMTFPKNAGYMAGTEVPIPVVGPYIEPGQLAYVVLAPHNIFLLNDKYKASSFTIVQVKVLGVSLLAGMIYETDICSRAYFRDTFANLSEAKQRLADIHAEKIGGTLEFDQMRVMLHAEMLAQLKPEAEPALSDQVRV